MDGLQRGFLMMNKYSVFVSFIATLIVSISIASATSLYVNPSTTSKTVGSTFPVRINVAVNNLLSYELKLSYNPSILEATNVTLSFLNEPTILVKKEINNVAGNVWIATSSIPPSSMLPAQPKSGSGTLATVTFKVKKTGTSNLHLYDVILIDSNTNDIVVQPKDGVFVATVPISRSISRPILRNILRIKEIGGISERYLGLTEVSLITVVIAVIILVAIYGAFRLFAKRK